MVPHHLKCAADQWTSHLPFHLATHLILFFSLLLGSLPPLSSQKSCPFLSSSHIISALQGFITLPSFTSMGLQFGSATLSFCPKSKAHTPGLLRLSNPHSVKGPIGPFVTLLAAVEEGPIASFIRPLSWSQLTDAFAC